jgi:hypothetical protein
LTSRVTFVRGSRVWLTAKLRRESDRVRGNFLSPAAPFSDHCCARFWFQLVEKVTRNHIDE